LQKIQNLGKTLLARGKTGRPLAAEPAFRTLLVALRL
jgi:hypothetical protein